MMDDPSLNKAIAMLLQAFPGSAVAIYPDGEDYRAGIISIPSTSAFTGRPTDCRDDPNTAVLRLRVIFMEMAQQSLSSAQAHLSDLTHSPFAERTAENGGPDAR